MDQYKNVASELNKIKKMHKKYGSNLSLSRRMTITNFDSEIDKASAKHEGQLNAIPEDKDDNKVKQKNA